RKTKHADTLKQAVQSESQSTHANKVEASVAAENSKQEDVDDQRNSTANSEPASKKPKMTTPSLDPKIKGSAMRTSLGGAGGKG
ncbi:unnamed protein product, partial [Amoebophrya sp. A120]